MGNAITNTPQMQQTEPITFPSGVVGQMSPYFMNERFVRVSEIKSRLVSCLIYKLKEKRMKTGNEILDDSPTISFRVAFTAKS